MFTKKTEEDVVMRSWKMELSGHRGIGRRKLRGSDAIRKDMKGVKIEDRRSTSTEKVENENSVRPPEKGKNQ